MAKIAKYGIRTLADLACKEKLIMIKHLLQEAFDDIIFWDKKIDYHALKQKEQDLYWLGSSHKFWKGHYEETGSNAIKKVRQFQNLICSHSPLNLSLIRELISDKWDYLIQCNEGIIRDFTNSSSQSQLQIVRDLTGSNVSTSGENIRKITTSKKINELKNIERNTSFSNLSIDKDLVSTHKQRRVCIVTGINISMQKDNSRFLSITGIRHLYKNDRDRYNILLSELPVKWHSAPLKIQEYKIAHYVRDKFFNHRNSTRRAIDKMCSKPALFDNRLLISKEKLRIANTP